jgi:HD-GYP domain-containing protein (c-di-GMP phosphodiesterase class II)
LGFWGKKKDFQRISVDALQPGMHVSLAERWLDHPFLLNEFTLESEEQIRIIIGLGMTTVLWCRAASDKGPREIDPDRPRGPAWSDLVTQAKLQREERRKKTDLSKQRTAGAARAYAHASSELRSAFSLAYSSPQTAVKKALGIVADVADAFNSECEISLVLLSDRLAGSTLHTHAINVMLLSLLVAKSQQVDGQGLNDLGLGALFHDIGMLKVPDAVRMKPESEWTRADQDYMRMHTDLGAKMTINLPEFGTHSRAVVALHHEKWDGSGYPFKIAGEKIPPFVRYVSVADRYDELCNPVRMQDGITPSQALSRMFKSEGSHFDPAVLASLIKCMGVYPPGSLVELSNGAVGLVTSVNRDNTLRPVVTMWQEDCKPEDAPIVDLAVESELKIERSLRPADLEPEVRDFLNPRARTAYFYAKAVAS